MNHKRVLFVVSDLNCGGINRSLENLLTVWNPKQNVDVLAFDTTGQYCNGFNHSVLLKTPFFLDYQIRHTREQNSINKLLCIMVKTFNRISHGIVFRRAIKRLQRKISNGGYGAIIAYSEGIPTSFVAGIETDNRIAWIHCDYGSYLSYSDGNFEQKKYTEKKYYDKYKHIVCVSKYTRNIFTDIFPEYQSKSIYIYNVLNSTLMKKQAEEFIVEEYDLSKFNIITLGRIDYIKNQSCIPRIASKLDFSDFDWYIIGPAIMQSEYQKLLEEINKYGLASRIHILGEKSNPYPYLKQADLVVNTSKSEACPYVINEAKVLDTPVVCCDFGSAGEFIENGVNGFSVSPDDISKTINQLHKDRSGYALIKGKLSCFEYDNNAIVAKFDSVLKG